MTINSNINQSLNSAVAGLKTASLQVNVSASNIVGASATDKIPFNPQDYGGYRPLDVNVTSNQGGQVTGVVPERSPSYVEGLNAAGEVVASPNVDYTEEALKMSQAKVAYKASAKALEVLDEMNKKVLDIKS